jgi:hypothetical protein
MMTNQTASTAHAIYFIMQIVGICLYYTRLVWGEGSRRRPGGYEGNESCTTAEFCTRFIMHVRCLTTELFYSVPAWLVSGIIITIIWGDCMFLWRFLKAIYCLLCWMLFLFRFRGLLICCDLVMLGTSFFGLGLCWFIATWLCWTLCRV